jgi:translation initiation factor IF-2
VIRRGYANILAFDVNVTLWHSCSLKKWNRGLYSQIIYRLFDASSECVKKCKDGCYSLKGQRLYPKSSKVVFDAIFNSNNPIIMGVIVYVCAIKTGITL